MKISCPVFQPPFSVCYRFFAEGPEYRSAAWVNNREGSVAVQFKRLLCVVVAGLFVGPTTPLGAQDTAAVSKTADTVVQGDAPTVVPAQPAPAAPAARRADIAAQLGFIDVLPARSHDRIRADQDDARSDEREAEAEYAHHLDAKERTKAMVEVKKREISTLDARRKLAEKSKEEADKVMLKAEKKDAERHKQLLERRVQLHDAEADRAKSAKALADATRRALELEMQLANRRAERARTGGLEPVATRRYDALIAELERKVLDAQRKRAEAQRQLADKDVSIAKRRLDLHKAQVVAAGR